MSTIKLDGTLLEILTQIKNDIESLEKNIVYRYQIAQIESLLTVHLLQRNREYAVGDRVIHPLIQKYILICESAGTTDSDPLQNIDSYVGPNPNPDPSNPWLHDGSVTWSVHEVKPLN